MPSAPTLQSHGFSMGPSRFLQAVESFAAGLRDGWAAYRRFRALQSLDAASLRRMGLTRQGLAREAVLPTRG